MESSGSLPPVRRQDNHSTRFPLPMAVQRLLGAAWTAVHGPSDPARLLRWLLEQGLHGMVPGPAPRALGWRAIAAAADGLPIAFPAVRATSILRENSAVAGLASARESDQQTARAAVVEAIGVARVLGARLVILDPGVVPLMGEVGAEDLDDPSVRWTNERAQAMLARRKAGLFAALDRTCRALFDLCKHHPDIRFCLTQGRSIRTVAGIDGLEAIVEDLGSARVGYWHDCAVAARREQVLGEAQGQWLDKFSNLCDGCTLGDSSGEGMYLPPGAGGVDYPLLAAYLRRPHGTLAACLELDPGVDRTELAGVRAYLERFGL